MATEYKLNYTASEINEKLGKIVIATEDDVRGIFVEAKTSSEDETNGLNTE